jgi:hypothetical protein
LALQAAFSSSCRCGFLQGRRNDFFMGPGLTPLYAVSVNGGGTIFIFFSCQYRQREKYRL